MIRGACLTPASFGLVVAVASIELAACADLGAAPEDGDQDAAGRHVRTHSDAGFNDSDRIFPALADRDSDGDGRSDLEEYAEGTD
ncbi:MAG: hypothetical protein ACODAG_00490, partial [Myxococcota bacterium]